MRLYKDHSLIHYNTFKINAKAGYFAFVEQESDLYELSSEEHLMKQSSFVLGGGSNVLFTDDYPGLIIYVNNNGIEIAEVGDHYELTVAAGESWPEFVEYCVNMNMQGLENLAMIPGSVGAAPVQNIGAYGVELKDVFLSCKAFNLKEKKWKIFEKEDCHFGYRHSIFKTELKGEYLIWEVKLRLNKIPDLNISYAALASEIQGKVLTAKTVFDAVCKIRSGKLPDPDIIGNAGSFFKNPVISAPHFNNIQLRYADVPFYPQTANTVKLPAAWLIEKIGYKGKSIGNAAVYEKQALVLTNTGNASGKEVLFLAEQIKSAVLEQFSIQLQAEVNIL